MELNYKFLSYNKYENFEADLNAHNISDLSIVFIKDTRQIWARGKIYSCNVQVNVDNDVATITDSEGNELIRLSSAENLDSFVDSYTQWKAQIEADIVSALDKTNANERAIRDNDSAILVLRANLQTLATAVLTTLPNVDETLSNRITSIENLIESDVDGAINKFNEIIDFLRNTQPSSNLQELLTNLSLNITNTQNGVDGLRADLTDTQTSLANTLNDVISAQNEINNIQSDVSTLQSSLNNTLAAINGMQTSISRVEDDIHTIDSNVGILFTRTGNLQNDMSAAQTNINGLQTAMSTAQTNIGNLLSSVNSLETVTSNAVINISNLSTGKQDALTAGTGIDITNNVISVLDEGTTNQYVEAKIRELYDYLNSLYVMKEDVYDPDDPNKVWATAPEYPYSEYPTPEYPDTLNRNDIQAMPLNTYDVYKANNQLRNDVCYFVYMQS